MPASLRIAVADDEADVREYFEKILPRLGHEVVAVATNGSELVEQCRAASPDLVLTDVKMPEMDGIEAAVALYRERPLPVILVTAYHDPDVIERAEADHVMGYLVKPIKQADLQPTIAIVMRRFAEFEALRREVVDLRKALDARRSVEAAKRVLIKRGSFEESAAFRRLQQVAIEKNVKLTDVAEMILTTEHALQAPE